MDDLGVYDVVGFVIGGYFDFVFGSGFVEFGENDVGSFFVILGFGEGNDDGEVDEFKSGGD